MDRYFEFRFFIITHWQQLLLSVSFASSQVFGGNLKSFNCRVIGRRFFWNNSCSYRGAHKVLATAVGILTWAISSESLISSMHLDNKHVKTYQHHETHPREGKNANIHHITVHKDVIFSTEFFLFFLSTLKCQANVPTVWIIYPILTKGSCCSLIVMLCCLHFVPYHSSCKISMEVALLPLALV